MNLEIKKLSRNSNPAKEHLILEPNGQVRLSDFCLLLKIRGQDSFKLIKRLHDIHPFSVNDRLLIYTGKGKDAYDRNDKKGLDYAIYMQSNTCIWAQPDAETVYLFDIVNSSAATCK